MVRPDRPRLREPPARLRAERLHLPASRLHRRGARGGRERLWQMEGAFEAVLTASWALFNLLSRLGIRPDALLGHSTGEYSAMHASGMIDLPDEERIARVRHRPQRASTTSSSPTAVKCREAALVAVGADSPTVSAVAAARLGRAPRRHGQLPAPDRGGGRGRGGRPSCHRRAAPARAHLRAPAVRPALPHAALRRVFGRRCAAFFSRWLTAPPAHPALLLHLRRSSSRRTWPRIRELAVQHWMKPVEFQQDDRGHVRGRRAPVRRGGPARQPDLVRRGHPARQAARRGGRGHHEPSGHHPAQPPRGPARRARRAACGSTTSTRRRAPRRVLDRRRRRRRRSGARRSAAGR